MPWNPVSITPVKGDFWLQQQTTAHEHWEFVLHHINQHAILLHLGISEGKSWNCERGYEISSKQAFRKVLLCDICVGVWKCVYSIKLWANIWKDSSLSNKSAEWRELYRMISKAYSWQLYIFYETVMHPVPFLNSLFYGCSFSILADRIY